MNYRVRKVAVLGSGVMGASIAAHFANMGIQVLMLDRVPEQVTKEEEANGLTLDHPIVRNRIANQNKKMLVKQKPSPITTKKSLTYIETGNLEDHMEKLAEVDWIIEVVVEDLQVKKKLLHSIDQYRGERTIVSSNTSGISVHKMIEDCSDEMKKHFLGTHFFNPPRYLKLLEVIPTKYTDSKVLAFIKSVGEEVLGKGVVEAKDTPNFIANRIGTYGLLVTVREMLKGGYSVGEVDSITGPIIGRPKSATFRTLDVVGLDTFVHVAKNVYNQVEGAEKEKFTVPSFMVQMNEKGWIGAKSRQGFYKKQGKEILEINPITLEYEIRKKLTTPGTEMAKREKHLNGKLKALLSSKGDRAGEFVWTVLKSILLYSAELVGEIADDVVAIDQAMKLGFGWETGPFETWDAIGLRKSVGRMQQEGEQVPKWVLNLLEDGCESFYTYENNTLFYYDQGEYKDYPFHKKEIHIHRLKDRNGIIKKNSGASLVDMGDGVALLEFHSKSNAIGLDTIQMINDSIEEVEKNYDGLVIGNQGQNFSVGANLALMLMEAQDGNFDELDLVIRKFQQTMMNIKYAEKPIVSATFNMTLGGGAEVALSTATIQASMETYIGLVEAGVGLIPGGGGTKELYLKQIRNLPKGISFDLSKVANDVFEKVATAKVSTSAHEGMELGFIGPLDQISVNPDHLLYEAKEKVLALAKTGYKKPEQEKFQVVGEAGYAAMLMGAKTLQYGGYASEHDLKIAEKLAYVLSGGRIREGSLITEQVMLDLEREAFLSLIGEPLTQARMQHMLLKGKPLRN